MILTSLKKIGWYKSEINFFPVEGCETSNFVTVKYGIYCSLSMFLVLS